MKAGRGPSPWAVGTIAAAVLAVGGIAWATIPDGASVIHGCYAVGSNGELSTNAALRVIDPNGTGKADSKACKSSEKALNFNAQGPQGPVGQQGPQGPAGKDGSPRTVAGLVNQSCALVLDPPATIVKAEDAGGPGHCRLIFGSEQFSDVPVLTITPIGGATVTDLFASQIGDHWEAEYTLSASSPVTFIASQISR